MMTTENESRALRAIGRIDSYAGEANDLEANIIDMLTDLRHLAELKEISFHSCLNSSHNHYKTERGGK